MSNIVEFVVRMKDMMSGGLGKLSSASQSSFGKMAQHADKMTQRNKILGASYDELQKKIKAVESQIRTSTVQSQISSARRELASLQRMAGKHPGTPSVTSGASSGGGGGFSVGGMALGGMVAGLALAAGTAFLGVVSDGIGSAISGSMQKERDLVGLSTFIGKAGATTAYANIRQDAQNTSYDTASLLKANRALISVDGNAKHAREDVMNLANAIAATGGGNDELQRMSINMQQIKSLGKASAADVKQFGYAGINIYSLLSKATGKSMKEVKEMDVTYDLLAKSLAMARSKGGLYAGALEAQGATMGGKWESVKDRTANALTDVGDAFAPIITKVLDIFIKISDQVQPLLMKAQPYINMISNGLGIAIDYVMSLSSGTGGWMDYVTIIAGVLGTVWDVLKGAGMVVFKIVGGILDWLGKSQIIKDLISAIAWNLEHIIKPIIGWLGDALVWIWESVLRPILDGLESAYKWVRDMVTDDNDITVEAKKTVINKNHPTAPSYQMDLTRFKDKGLIGDTEDKKKKNKESSKKAGDTISGGGTRNITINLGKFFDTIQFTTLNNNESREELEKLLMEMMGRVLFNGGQNA